MSQEIIVRNEAAPDDLMLMNAQELRMELGKQLRITAENLVRLAWIVRLLEEAGEDLSDLRIGMLSHLRRIAYGQVIPELVVRFAASPLVLQRASLLPLPDQANLASGGMVELVVRRDTGFDKRMADPAKMERSQMSQVFGPDRIRSAQEQILYLEARPAKQPAKPKTTTVGKVRVDRSRGGLVLGRTFVPHAEVLRALADLAGTDTVEEADEASVPLVVRVSEDDHRSLKVAAARGNTTMGDLVRNALRAAGLI